MLSPVLSPRSYAEVRDYLFGLKARGVKFGIDRMRQLAAALGQPERAVPVVHVAGTNGKGSVSAMLAAIAEAAGWRVGLYTSPHLVHLGERIQVARKPLSEAEIMAYAAELAPVVAACAQGQPDDQASFFELMTAMAFLHFQRQSCDLAVIEVGLGGRLDATNIVVPEVAVITSIGLDHCELLGDTLEQIAGEKAGIIKPGIPVILGRMPLEAERVIRAIAQERGAPLRSVREEFGETLADYPKTILAGDYQRWNAATANLAAACLPVRWRLTPGVIESGLQKVHWPGRWEQRQVGGRLLILDASHNPEGAAVLEANLAKLVAETGRAPLIVTGVLGVARAQPLLATLARHAAALYLVQPQQPRATPLEVLAALVPPTFAGPVVPSTIAEVFPRADHCALGGTDDVIVVTGSIYLLGEVLARLEPAPEHESLRLQDF